MPSILLRNATVLTHAPLTANGGDGDGQYRVIPLWRHSVLICNALIARITPDIEPPNADTKVIDCTDKIVSPGFVDTHHHLWQTQSKGRHANELLLDYLGTGPSRLLEAGGFGFRGSGMSSRCDRESLRR